MSTGLFLAIATSSMIPITELRATIPIFLASHPETPIWFIFTAAVVGNMIPNFAILWFLPQLTKWLHNHVAPRINRTVLWGYDYFIKNERSHYIYNGVAGITLLGLLILYYFQVANIIWYLVVLITIPFWFYIILQVANKAYRAAKEEKSIIHWFYNKIRKEHSAKFYKWGSLALILIVGIPVPGTGSWSGSVLAFLFNIPYWKALGLIFIGILMAGVIVTALSTGILNGLSAF